VTRVADLALRIAVRRWPAPLRGAAAREWGAELHEIRHDPGVPPARRGLRATRFAVSLAVARPPGERPPGVLAGVRAGAWRPIPLFLAAPLLCLLVEAACVTGSGQLPELVRRLAPSGTGFQVAQAAQELSQLLVVVVAVGAGLLLGRRRTAGGGTDAGAAGRLATLYALSLGAGTLLLVGPATSAARSRTLLTLALLWCALLIPALWAALAGARLRTVAPFAGGACYLAATAAVWLRLPASAAPRAYAPLWFPTMLLPQGWVPAGTGADGSPASFTILDVYPVVPFLLLGATGFALTYLSAARRPHRAVGVN